MLNLCVYRLVDCATQQCYLGNYLIFEFNKSIYLTVMNYKIPLQGCEIAKKSQRDSRARSLRNVCGCLLNTLEFYTKKIGIILHLHLLRK
ncbi:hypothetical protein GLYMA_04G156800v4 [Glycine max]|uniref:Uncharacterized protein n=2 Tax=Glycine subgen. Soja TaxID=1462606 RepID=K7KK83_SOYBN|nr:hypothetical protein JHK85_010606 [Glycine max]KHN31830.1 hypothetical protein glysoja_044311 [Glycine soja]KAG5066593.1 hypothetical protein JHK86_010324 [Glycine max]KAH1111534.1 hypothetical protein GYH30_010078 [Glycine max]KRH63134.1 hypothetical protein GLYMA_04G156800v4 [Glycine max]